jgi:hypothetical protein
MAVENYLTTAVLSEIVRYRSDADFSSDGVRFRGAVRKHPYDAKKFLIITSPLEDDSHFYEFRLKDVLQVRDVSQMVTEDRETIQIVDVTVRKGSLGIEMKPIQVT